MDSEAVTQNEANTEHTHVLTGGRGAAAYSLARGVAVAVTGESGGGSVLSGMRGKATANSPVGRENFETVAKR